MAAESCKSTVRFLSRHFNASLLVKGCALALMLIATNGFAIEADQKANSNPCNVTAEDAAGLAHELKTNVHALRYYTAVIAGLLKSEKFDELDCIADHARSGKEKFSGGGWRLHTIYAALGSPIQYPVTQATQEDWKMHLLRLQRWTADRPKSITPRVALAGAYVEYAWDARGQGYSDTVSDSGWKLFEERIGEAQQVLKEALALPTKCPEWYLVTLHVAQHQKWNETAKRALFDEASKFEPDYYYYGRVYATYLLPQWSGDATASEKFVREIADRVGGERGDILYYQVATAPDLICGCERDPTLSTERIERGFAASEKKYGVSMLNLNRMLFLASQYKDSDSVFAMKILPRIGDQIDEGVWKEQADFEYVKQWAANWAPVVAKTREIEATAQANMQTVEGARYRATFEKPYRDLLQQCVRTDGGSVNEWTGKFKTFTQVGADGTLETGFIEAMNPVVMCVRQRMGAAHQQKLLLFPPPPQASYWVRLDLDWADFAPVAAK